MKLKEKIYNIIADGGIWGMQKLFPEYFAQEPLRPTDRYYEYPFILSRLPKHMNMKILDVGCSGSIFPLILNALGYEVTGIDIRNYYPEHKFFFVRRNIYHSLFKNEEFDCVTCVSALEHIGLKGRYGVKDDMQGDFKAMKEIHRILKPDGLLFITVPYGNYLDIRRNHKVYDANMIQNLMQHFMFNMEIVDSPEDSSYRLALIHAVKVQ